MGKQTPHALSSTHTVSNKYSEYSDHGSCLVSDLSVCTDETCSQSHKQPQACELCSPHLFYTVSPVLYTGNTSHTGYVINVQLL